ncbi:MAG: thiamine biosynthesis protein ThiS [Bacteroidetes bacterium GWF2_38_335]|nr:MAG: thiamine biosynthesis protein ThiS [Bacteroidetes bacterium GWF2_38_335]OFY80565.1 MAG: thiamine biosynthesis protein ThiS [Bacteroidetes bacterium RIFOXYA12_FULL_38_20]
MIVFLNNQLINILEGSTIPVLLKTAGIEDIQGTAVAVNNIVISREVRESHVLNDQDKVLVIRAAKGG